MNKQLIKNILSEELFGYRINESLDQEILVNYFYDEFLLEKLLIGEPVSLEELRKILNSKIVNFEFIKLDGDVRPAKGTTMMKHIPPVDHPSGSNPSSDKVATFYDLSKGVWRSVSNKSKEVVLIQDKDTGKLKVQVSDKKPVEEPTKPSIPKEPDVSKRPLVPPAKPVVRPSIRPEVIPPTPKPEEIEPEVKETPLDIQDPTISADDIKDTDIIAPTAKEPEVEIEPETEVEPEEKEAINYEDIIFPPDEEDITFPDEDEEEDI